MMRNTKKVKDTKPYAPEERVWYRKTIKIQARNFNRSLRRKANIGLRHARYNAEHEINTGAERRTLSHALMTI